MNPQFELILWVFLATLLAALMIYKKLNHRDMNSGLVLLLLANIYLIHYSGAFVHTFPWYVEGNVDLTLKGFRLTVIGLLSFVFACLIVSPHVIRLLPLHKLKGYGTEPNIDIKKLTDVGLMYFAIGIGCTLIVISRLVLIPTIGGFFNTGIFLAVIGACFMCLRSIIKKNIYELLFWIGIAMTFPLVTIVFSGHIGFGLIWLLIVVFFVIKYINPKRKLVFFGIIIAYLGLSLFQTYMRDRGELRELIKSGSETSRVVEHVQQSFIDPELFNPFDSKHLDIIAIRLNQNTLVGEGVDYMSFRNNFVMGKTLMDSFLALVPRIVWPEKTINAGNDDYVFEFTGTFIPDDTVVGLGYVLELYGNFATWGVIVGFFILGLFLSIVDFISAYHLRMGNWREFVIWFLPATAFTNPEIVIATIVSASMMLLILTYAVSKIPTTLFRPVLFLVAIAAIFGAYVFVFMPLISPIQIYFQLLLVLVVSYFGLKYYLKHYRKRSTSK
ncbi:MAG: hypothetical protein DHS20C13_06650 [Thermodesulfobacteriota bacterium]|nr:MAG: hypothetical protein DHS20C13_06650 [Thermodesulfobacteriota bacterium]